LLDLHHPETEFILRAVRLAARLARRVQEELVTPALTKEDRSPVTVADYASQALVAALLQRHFPGDVLVGEESAARLRQPQGQQTLEQVVHFLEDDLPGLTPEMVCDWIDRGRAEPEERFWTLDPVDGTKGFLRGDQYAVALALVEDDRVQLGALGCPGLRDASRPDLGGPGSLLVARRGQGTWVAPLSGPDDLVGDGSRFQQLHVSECADPAEARLLRSVEAGHTDVGKIDQFVDAMGATAPPVPMDSQAKYAVLAAGGGELVMRLLTPSKPDYREKIWDQAAGAIVVEEAGGRISDLDGAPLDFTRGRTLSANRGVLASNGLLHPAALSALRRVDA
jgi:3'(2'), 5'-bisphosphate nucleotidase